MPTLQNVIPDADDVLSLEPEELAGTILALLNATPSDARQFHPGYFCGEVQGCREPYPREQVDEILKGIMAAMGWREAEHLIARQPTAGGYYSE